MVWPWSSPASWWAQVSGAVVAAVCDIVILGERRNYGSAAGDLADAVQDDFRAAAVQFDVSLNLDGAARQTADVASIFQSGSEDHHRERARHLILAEVEKVDAFSRPP
jgi:hypothetical protein